MIQQLNDVRGGIFPLPLTVGHRMAASNRKVAAPSIKERSGVLSSRLLLFSGRKILSQKSVNCDLTFQEPLARTLPTARHMGPFRTNCYGRRLSLPSRKK